MLNIVIFGPPGAGKGTQSTKIIETYNLLHLSTGNLLRDEVNAKTPLGLQAQPIIAAGNLVSDEIIIGVIENKLNENINAKGFIFDGFPRTVFQAEALDNLFTKIHSSVTLVIALEVDSSELEKRLLNRALQEGRSDDNEESIKTRLNLYYNKTLPVATYYESKNKLVKIQGEGDVNQIFTEIKKAIDQVL